MRNKPHAPDGDETSFPECPRGGTVLKETGSRCPRDGLNALRNDLILHVEAAISFGS
jgi:hypothetical protein